MARIARHQDHVFLSIRLFALVDEVRERISFLRGEQPKAGQLQQSMIALDKPDKSDARLRVEADALRAAVKSASSRPLIRLTPIRQSS